MQRISLFLLFFVTTATTVNAAYLPVVDVSKGGVSARAAFGEDVKPVIKSNPVVVAPMPQQIQKKVVARSVQKTSESNITVGGDVLKPNRPRSDLWAKNNDTPLRMPRADEIAVINSDDLLPEESLDLQKQKTVVKVTKVAKKENTEKKVSEPKVAKNKNSDQRVSTETALNEIKKLREEIARLSAAQRDTEEKITRARQLNVQTPISGKPDVRSYQENQNANIRREIISDDFDKKVIARNTINSVKDSDTIPEPKIARVNEMSTMSPNELKKAFKKTYMSENKHLSTYPVDDKFDVVSDMSSSIVGFDASSDLSEMDAGVRPMEIKISFLNNDAGLSRENYNLLSETAAIVVNNPKRAIQIAIPESVTHNNDSRKLAARRLAIIEQVLRDTGIAERRIVPVLSQRSDDVFVLRIISGDVFESLTEQKRNMFGDSISKKTYKSMSW